MQTTVLITALAKAKICLSKGNSTFRVNLLKNVTATNTTTEKIPINNFAFLSFF